MMAFWIAVAALTLVALAFMIVPLVRKPSIDDAAPVRSAFDITVYKDQLKEIERDLERGVLSEDQALAARTEIERRMLAAAQENDTSVRDAKSEAPKTSFALLTAILIAVPAGAVAFYLYLGQPQLKDQPLAQRQMQGETEGGVDRKAEVQQMLAQLAQRVKDNPKDIEAWLIQGQAFSMMNRFDDAVSAYQQVVGLTDRHPDALTALAEAMIMAQETIVKPAAKDLLKEIKAKDPSEPRAYFYLAMERQQQNDLAGAMDEYVALLKVTPSDAEWVEQIEQRMQGLADEMEVSVPVVEMLPPQGPPPGENAAQGLTAEQIEGAQEMSSEDQQSLVRSMVQRLADRLKDAPDDLAGWQRLAQAYEVLGEPEKLAEAQAQIKRLQAQ